VQSKGWFDGRVGRIWINTILKPYLEGSTSSYLLVDHMKVHLTGDFVRQCNDLGSEVDYIPAGYTCVLQPLDVGVNGPFKASLRNYHHDWCVRNYPSLRKGDKFPTPERDDIYPWVISSFAAITGHSIRKTFQHIGFIPKDSEVEVMNAAYINVNGESGEVDIDPSEMDDEFSDETLDRLQAVLL